MCKRSPRAGGERLPTSKKIQCDVQDMVRFIVRSIIFENGNTAVDVLTQIERFNHLHDWAKPSGRDRLGSISELQFKRWCLDGGSRWNFGFINPAQKAALALLQFFLG